VLAPGPQPAPRLQIPNSLLRALDTFMIGATYKRTKEADQNCAFLCHVSTRTSDHKHIVELLRRYKTLLATGLKERNSKLIERLEAAYDDLAFTHRGLKESRFQDLVEAIAFLSPGIAVKLVNGETDEDVAVKSPYNPFRRGQ
jgi:Z1 domain